MPDVTVSVGTVVSVVVAEPATYDSTGFGNLSYIEVGEVTNLGEFGGTAQIIEHTPIKTGIIKKLKGSINYGTLALNIGKIVAQVGQAILKAGFDGAQRDTIHSFKIENSDGAIAYFTGLVGSYSFVTNDANTVLAVNSNVELNNKVIEDSSGAVSAPAIIATFVPPAGVVATPYVYDASIVFSGTVDSYAMIGSLPAGLQIDNDTGFIYGTPTGIGTSTGLDVSATNAGGTTSSADSASITIT